MLGQQRRIFFGGMSEALLDILHLPTPPNQQTLFVGAGVICFGLALLGMVAMYAIQKLVYAQLIAYFYKDEVELQDGFLNKQRKFVSYKNIREITIEQGILQRRFNLGTLAFITAAQEGSSSASGIKIQDVANPEAVYQQIRGIIQANSH